MEYINGRETVIEANETVLEGCEVLCLTGDLVACPLPPEEQKVCRERLQYEAGVRKQGYILAKHAVEVTYFDVDRLARTREVVVRW